MIRLVRADDTYYFNANLIARYVVTLLSDKDGEYRQLIINDESFDERNTEGFQDCINILEGLTLKIQSVSPIMQPSLVGKYQ